jgi:ubiquinone/menaquinone biosynthesis C-methylase UbiE
LQGGVPQGDGVWADLGAGSGAFTLALAELLEPDGRIFVVDQDAGALKRNESTLRKRFPRTESSYLVADFTRLIDLPLLDGVVMANSLHFYREKEKILKLVSSYIRLGGRLILVEYDSDRGNVWVPHPLSFQSWKVMAVRLGFGEPILLATYPSRFLGSIYAALTQIKG